ncbi:MAG: hypothetical protein LBL51_03240 [Synergistaceae bacterium]|nr:hypothetical protein [Synergistaceae bacterium]
MQLYPAGAVAQLFLISERWVRELTKQKILIQAKRGLYELAPTIQAYIRYLTKKARDSTAGGEDSEKLAHRRMTAETEEREAKARKAQVAVAISEGRLMKRDEVVREWTERVLEVRSALLELPRRVGSRFLDTGTRSLVEEEVERTIHEILERYSRRGISLNALLDGGGTGGAEASAAADGEPVGG